MLKLNLNPHLFLYPGNHGFILWDCLNHQQYEIDKPTLNALYDLSQGHLTETHIDDFIEANICSTQDFPDFEWGWDPLSKFYHVGVSDIFEDLHKSPDEFVKEYLEIQEEDEAAEEVPCDVLFKSEISQYLQNIPFGEVLLKRKTTRQFEGSSLTIEKIGELLYASCGEIHGEWTEILEAGYKTSSRRRSFPSGGALYPFRVLLIAIRVEGLKPGVYEYHPRQNGLKRIKDLSGFDMDSELTDILSSQYFCEGLSAGIVFLPAFEKAWGKYPHSRSYRDVFFEMGHCSQSILLTATALEMQTWMTAAFKDEKFKSLLGIDKMGVYPLCFIGIGKGSSLSLPKKF